MTQCVEVSRISNPKGLRTYCENVVQQINCKNAGVNTQVDLAEAVSNIKLNKNTFMFFGADLINSKNVTSKSPSYAGE